MKNFFTKTHYKILLNYFIGPILFLVLTFVIYNKVKSQSNLEQTWEMMKESVTGSNKWWFFCLFVLMFFNWGIEAKKWQLLAGAIEDVNYFKACKAVLSGVAMGLFLPNGIGEYFGKIVFMKEGNRLRSVSLTIVGSLSQLIVTIAGGLIGLISLRFGAWQNATAFNGISAFWVNVIISMIAMGILLLLFIYFKIGWLTSLLERAPFIQKYKWLIEHLESFERQELTRILLLSFIRYLIFIVQYLIALYIFGVGLNMADAAFTTSVLFLVLAVLPTIPFADIGVRSEAGRQLFGILSTNTLGIVVTTAGIWFINLVIPAVAGSLFILSIKIFRNR